MNQVRLKELQVHAPLLAVLALPLLILAPALLPGRDLSTADILLRSYLFADARPAHFVGPANDLLGDPVQQFIPWRRLVTGELLNGRIPLWTPHAFAGSPLLGNFQSAVFDPLSLPYLLAREDPSRATVWVALLRMWVAGIGAYFLARRLGGSFAAAALAGMAYGSGGFTLVWLLFPHASSSAWLPWAVMAAEAMAGRRGPGPMAAVALALAAGAFGGHPEVAFFSAVAVSLYVLMRRWQLREGGARAFLETAGCLVAAGVLTVLLTAVQTLPFVAAIRQGSIVGARQSPAHFVLLPRVAWETVATQAFPYLFGRPLRAEGAILGAVTNFCEDSGRYVSLLGLVLALLGAASLPRRAAARCLGAVTGLAWLYSASIPPVSTIVGLIPGFGLLPPRRADFVVLLGLAVLAGLGLDALIVRRMAGVRSIAASLAGAAALAFAVGLWMRFGAPGHDRITTAAATAPLLGNWLASKGQGEIAADFVRLAPMYGARFVLPWAIFAAASALWLGRWSALRPNRRVVLASVIVGADLLYFGWGFNPALPREQVFPPSSGTKLVSTLAGDGRALVMDQWLGIPANLGVSYGWDDVLGYDAVGRQRLETLLGMGGPFTPGPSSFPLLHYDRTDARVLDLLSVRVVTSRRPLEAPNLEFVARIGEGFLYRNPTALSRAFLPFEVVAVSGAEAALERMKRADFRPERTAVVEAPAALRLAPAHGTVRLGRPAPGRLRLAADLESGGVVVIGEGFDPGWRANDGATEVKIFPCDLAVMAIRLGSGHHEVDLEYRPQGWGAAIAMTVLGIALAGALLLWRRPPPRPASRERLLPRGTGRPLAQSVPALGGVTGLTAPPGSSGLPW